MSCEKRHKTALPLPIAQPLSECAFHGLSIMKSFSELHSVNQGFGEILGALYSISRLNASLLHLCHLNGTPAKDHVLEPCSWCDNSAGTGSFVRPSGGSDKWLTISLTIALSGKRISHETPVMSHDNNLLEVKPTPHNWSLLHLPARFWLSTILWQGKNINMSYEPSSHRNHKLDKSIYKVPNLLHCVIATTTIKKKTKQKKTDS